MECRLGMVIPCTLLYEVLWRSQESHWQRWEEFLGALYVHPMTLLKGALPAVWQFKRDAWSLKPGWV